MHRAFVLVLAISFPASCKRQTSADQDVIAKVGDHLITVGDLQRQIESQPRGVRARYASPERKKELLDSAVNFELLAHEAEKRGYERDPDVQRLIKQQMVNELVRREFTAKMNAEGVPDAEVERYYREHAAEFARDEEVRVSQIVVKDSARAQKLTTAAKSLAPADEPGFRDLATSNSEHEASRIRGGDLGFFDRKTSLYPQPIVEAAFGLRQVGQVAGPLKTDQGYHILRLTERRPGFARSLADVKEQIRSRLRQELRARKMDEWIAAMRSETPVKIYDDKFEALRLDIPTPPSANAQASGR
jgi:peptidyl-prolyl cis-trans isomerase C